jgi:hypothetical protein
VLLEDEGSRARTGREINHDNMRSRPFPVISPTCGPRVGKEAQRERGDEARVLLHDETEVPLRCWAEHRVYAGRAGLSQRGRDVAHIPPLFLYLPPSTKTSRGAHELDGKSITRVHVAYMSRRWVRMGGWQEGRHEERKCRQYAEGAVRERGAESTACIKRLYFHPRPIRMPLTRRGCRE